MAEQVEVERGGIDAKLAGNEGVQFCQQARDERRVVLRMVRVADVLELTRIVDEIVLRSTA